MAMTKEKESNPGLTRGVISPSGGQAGAATPWARIACWFIMSRLLIWGAAGLSTLVLAPGKYFTPTVRPMSLLTHWDAAWYLDVINNGYHFDPGQMSNVNFLPLYPLLVRVLNLAVPNVEIAAYIMSNAAAFGAAVLIWHLTYGLNLRVAAADGAVLFFLFGPVSFFFATIYSESTFLFFVVSALIAARKRLWLLAGVCGAFASSARSIGILLVIPIAVEFLQNQRFRDVGRSGKFWVGLLGCALPAVGLLLYMGYLGWRFDEPRAYFISQHYGGHGYSYIWDTFVSRHFNGLTPFYKWWFGGAVLAGVSLLLTGVLLRLPYSLTAFALACCLLYFSIKTLECMPRFLSVVAPFYCTLGEIKARSPALGEGLLAISAALLAFSVALFANGYWFT